jgi:hypothetical protein
MNFLEAMARPSNVKLGRISNERDFKSVEAPPTRKRVGGGAPWGNPSMMESMIPDTIE